MTPAGAARAGRGMTRPLGGETNLQFHILAVPLDLWGTHPELRPSNDSRRRRGVTVPDTYFGFPSASRYLTGPQLSSLMPDSILARSPTTTHTILSGASVFFAIPSRSDAFNARTFEA